MAFKPNYNQQRAERNRAKQAKKDEKRRDQEEEVARRKSGETDPHPQAGHATEPSGTITSTDEGTDRVAPDEGTSSD